MWRLCICLFLSGNCLNINIEVGKLFVFLFSFLCLSCTNKTQKKAACLNKELETVTITSFAFDSLLQEVNLLPSYLQVPILLNISSREESLLAVIKKQEEILVYALSIASKKQKIEILLQLSAIYGKLSQLGLTNVTLEGIKRCDELLNNYSLPQDDIWKVNKMKITFLNEQKSYKESLLILYEMLKEHREAKNIPYIIDDLCTIANYLARLGDSTKALSMYKEAYQLSLDNKMFSMTNTCLAFIIDISFDLKLYSDVINYSYEIDREFINKDRPSVYSTLATCYLKLQKPDSARFCLNMIRKKESRGTGIFYYCRMAETYIAENNEDSATVCLRKALQQFENQKVAYSQHKATLPLYFMYVYPSYATLLFRNGKVQQAAEAFRLVETLLKEPVNEPARFEKQIDALDHYSSFCLSTKQYKKASDLLIYRDSIQKLYYQEIISRDSKSWTERFEIQELKTQGEMREQELKSSIRLNSLIATAAIILFVVTLAFLAVIYFLKKKNKKYHNRILELITPPQPAAPPNKREPLTPQEQLYKSACKLVKNQKLFLDSALTLDKLAEKLSTNRTSLSKAINVHAERNFNQWINKARIDYALTRIDTVKKLGTLYKEVGFLSQNTFINSFKDNVGCTPSEYLKSHRSDAVQDESVEA